MYCRLAKIVVLAVVFYLSNGLAVSYAISSKEEIEIGQKVAVSIEKQYGLVDNKDMQNRVAEIGRKLAAKSDRPELPYVFKVLNVGEVNALSLPGGFVYVNKGLIEYMPSDDELAGVLAHEIGHIAKRHSIRQMEKSMGMGILLAIALGEKGGFLTQLAYSAIMAGYSRSDEREADHLGFLYSLKAGFNPYGLQLGMQKLAELEDKPRYGLFSDHPEPEARVALLESYAKEGKITPVVKVSGPEAAVIADGDWQLPPITVAVDGYKPLYRAYLLAGNLYKVSQQQGFDGGKFITFNEEDKIKIYYDDVLIYTLTMQDALAVNTNLSDLAESFVRSVKKWADDKSKGLQQEQGSKDQTQCL